MKMKLLEEFKNKYNNITYKIYELDNGMKLLHLVNPSTVDSDFAVIVKAGCAFEIKENVPRGTAHFLEHMLLNPNDTFKTFEEIIQFEQGNKKRPNLQINAQTGYENITFTGHCNEKGLERLLERIQSEFEFSKDMVEKQMEKERGIILAEKSRDLKRTDDEFLCFRDFLLGKEYPELTSDLIGKIEDISKISAQDLETYFQKRFTKGNTILTLQSNKDIDEKLEKHINRFGDIIPDGKADAFREIIIDQKYDIGTFQDKRANGITVALEYLFKDAKKIDYRDLAMKALVKNLFQKVTFNILREKKSLIYGLKIWSYRNYFYNYSDISFELTTEKQNVSKMLEELDNVLNEYTFEFLDSKAGEEWFEDIISHQIYPRTTRFQNRLADKVAEDLFIGGEIFNDNKYVEEFKDIGIPDVKKYLKDFLKIPPRIWIKSDLSKKKMLEIIHNSPFEKRFREK